MSVEILLPPETVRRVLPGNLSVGDERLFSHETEKVMPETCLSRLKGVTVLPNGYVVRGPALWPLPEAFTNSARSPAQALRRVAQRIHDAPFQVSPLRVKRGLLVTDEFSNGYFHWIADCLPRLFVLAGKGLLNGETLIVPDFAGKFSYAAPSLAAFGLLDTVFPGPHSSVLCDELTVLSPVAPTGNYRPSVMQGLRRMYRDGREEKKHGKRIYASRAIAVLRRIENEEEVHAIFEHHGFERVFLERLSFQEQVRLVGSAQVFAGNHGAGLVNMTWMLPGTFVLELRRRGDAQNNCFYSLASALDLRYFYMSCDPVSRSASAHRADLQVDPKELDHRLSELVGSLP